MLRLKCLSALASIKCQIAISGKLTAATIDAANSLWDYRRVPMAKSFIYDNPSRRKDGSRLKIGTNAKFCDARCTSAIE